MRLSWKGTNSLFGNVPGYCDVKAADKVTRSADVPEDASYEDDEGGEDGE